MKRFILGLFFTFSIIAGAQTPSNNLNYVKLLKVPPVGQAKDSVLVFDNTDGYMKMRPQSTLSAAKATSAKSGTVKTDITQADPLVYTKTTTDALLDIKAENSAGALSGFAITDNGNGTANIASGQALLRATNSETGILQKYAIAAITNLTLTDNANNYVLANYNAGNPTLTVTTDPTQINGKTTTIVYVIARVGNTLHYLNLSGANVDSNGKLRARFLNTEALKRAQGMAIGFANRNISVTAGLSYSGLIPIQTTAFNTATGSTFTNFYGTTRQTGQTQINNTQYNNAGVLTAMPNNSFRTDYVYVLANNPSKLYVIMGGTSPTLTAARAVAQPSALPVELQYLGVLVGRTIIAKDATVLTEVSSAFDVVFNSNGVTNYSDLAGLPTIDQTLIDGSSNAVSNNAVFDGLAGKFNTPTGLTTNQLIKWNGSGFGNTAIFDNGIKIRSDLGFISSSSNPTEIFKSVRFTGNGGLSITDTGGEINLGTSSSSSEFIGGRIFIRASETWVAGTAQGSDIVLANCAIGTTTLVDRVILKSNGETQVNGNITASPAVAPNQVVVKSQLDAVAGTSGTYTPTLTAVVNCTSLLLTNATYIKTGNVVSVNVGISFTSPTANLNSAFTISLPFGRTSAASRNAGSGCATDSSNASFIPVFCQLQTTTSAQCNTKPTISNGSYILSVSFQYDITQ